MSTSVHRHFFSSGVAAERIVGGGTELLAHLSRLDPRRVACIENSMLYTRAGPGSSDRCYVRRARFVGDTWRGLAPFLNMRVKDALAAADTLLGYGQKRSRGVVKKTTGVKRTKRKPPHRRLNVKVAGRVTGSGNRKAGGEISADLVAEARPTVAKIRGYCRRLGTRYYAN